MCNHQTRASTDPQAEEISRAPILDPEHKHASTIARDWARQHLLPWATADNFATWYATSTVGRTLFGEDDLEDAFEWWSAEQPDLTHPDE